MRRDATFYWVAFIFACGVVVVAASPPSPSFCVGLNGAAAAGRAGIVVAARAQDGREEIRLRSFAPGARGRLTIEPTTGGGRARLTVLGLPRAETLAPTAQTFIVWASGDGRIVRLGELLTDARGNGGLEFMHPASFERYTVIVTAEANVGAERPSAPVLSTRANEARSLYATSEAATVPSPATKNGDPIRQPTSGTPPSEADLTPSMSTRSRRRGGDFYTEVDDALDAGGGGRVLQLAGAQMAQNARGRARVTTQTGTAFGRVRFRDLPLPSAIGANTYVLWGVVADGRIFYMGSLPTDADINRAEIYVRTHGVGAGDFNLFVTAEQQRPTSRPSDQRVLSTSQKIQRVK